MGCVLISTLPEADAPALPGAGAGGVAGASIEPAAAPDLPDSIEPEPLIPEESLVNVDRWRIEVVSDVLDALTPDSLEAAVPMVSSVLLLQPTSAIKSAAVNKLFFICIFLNCSLEKEGPQIFNAPGVHLFET